MHDQQRIIELTLLPGSPPQVVWLQIGNDRESRASIAWLGMSDLG